MSRDSTWRSLRRGHVQPDADGPDPGSAGRSAPPQRAGTLVARDDRRWPTAAQAPPLADLPDSHHVARRVAERAVPYAVGHVYRLLHHLGARSADLLEHRVHVFSAEDQPLQ